jgi:hypothetical protein
MVRKEIERPTSSTAVKRITLVELFKMALASMFKPGHAGTVAE